jgi:hypothetical protein
MQLISDGISVLGSRHGIIWEPVARQAYIIRSGKFPGVPCEINAGIRVKGRTLTLPLTQQGEDKDWWYRTGFIAPQQQEHQRVFLVWEGEPGAGAKRCLCSGDGEDHLKIILSGDGSPTIDIELSSIFAYPEERWLICGSKGGLHGTASKLDWKWVDFSSMPERKLELASTPDRSYNGEELTWHEDSWEDNEQADTGSGAAPAAKPVLALYQGLYRAICEGAEQDLDKYLAYLKRQVCELCSNYPCTNFTGADKRCSFEYRTNSLH